MGGISKKKGKQRGASYEIQCVSDVIQAKELKGQDASFERNLLKKWSVYPEFKEAKVALDNLDKSKKLL